MAKGMKHGAGGGASLNFKVVGNPQPENPKENTIWVDTDVKITGWFFTATKPETATQGMVWFPTSTVSNVAFNALKKNGIQVYPLYANQYIDGAWVEKTAKSYQNGEWVNWIYELYLYDTGTISEAAGSLVQIGVKYGGSVAGTCTITQLANMATVGTLGGQDALAYFSNKIDLTNFKNLYFNGSVVAKSDASANWCGIGVWKAIPTTHAGTEASAIMEGYREDGIHELNIENCTGEHYVGIVVHGFGTAAGPYLLATMKQLWLK